VWAAELAEADELSAAELAVLQQQRYSLLPAATLLRPDWGREWQAAEGEGAGSLEQDVRQPAATAQQQPQQQEGKEQPGSSSGIGFGSGNSSSSGGSSSSMGGTSQKQKKKARRRKQSASAAAAAEVAAEEAAAAEAAAEAAAQEELFPFTYDWDQQRRRGEAGQLLRELLGSNFERAMAQVCNTLCQVGPAGRFGRPGWVRMTELRAGNEG